MASCVVVVSSSKQRLHHVLAFSSILLRKAIFFVFNSSPDCCLLFLKMPFAENSKVIIKKGLIPGIITECVGPKCWKVTLVDETGKKTKDSAAQYTSQKLRHPKPKEWPPDQQNTSESEKLNSPTSSPTNKTRTVTSDRTTGGQRARQILNILTPGKFWRQQPHSAAETNSSEDEDSRYSRDFMNGSIFVDWAKKINTYKYYALSYN